MDNNLGEYIRQKRKQSKRRLHEIAKTCGISVPYLSDLERGHRIGSVRVWGLIGQTLGIPEVTLRSLYVMDAMKVAEREWDGTKQ